MSFLRRVTLGLVLLLIPALTVGSTSAATGDISPSPRLAQTATTPAEICTAAGTPEPETRDFEQADEVLKDGVDYWAVICTEEGPIYVDLFEEQAPITVNNFVFLAQQGYYNNTTFHRVLAGFMAQGGDPTGTGGGGPGYEFGDETDNGLGFDRAGLLAMANAGPGTNGSQFFITYAPTTWLDGNHTIFGEVFQGIEVAERLRIRDPQMVPDFEGAALETVVIVDDPTSVSAEPDGVPSLDHLQYMLENVATAELNTIFVKNEEGSHVYDLDAEAESYAADGGDELVDYLRAYLSDHGFLGTAAVYLPLSECPPSPEQLPVWLLGFQIADYGTPDAADKIVTDEDRAAKFVETGAAGASEVPMGLTGRMFSTPTDPDAWCGPDGTYYRLEYPYGRYIVVVDLVLDNTVVNDQTEPNPVQFLASVMDDFLLRSLAGTLDRGNAALAD